MTATDLYSTDPCPRCNGSGHKIDPSALRKILDSTELTQAQIAQKMDISPQFLCDLLNDRRDWTSNLLKSFLTAVGAKPNLDDE